MSPSAGDRYSTGATPNAPAEQAPAGIDLAESVLVARFWERIRLFATRRLRDVASAEDVAQETIRRVIEALRAGRVQDLDALPGFVFQTARHICLQRMRSSGRENRAMERMAADSSEASEAPDVLTALVSAERCAAVRAALASLDPPDRELLELLYYEAVDSADVAARLGISAGALRVRKHRAVRRLSELLGESVP
ncbi:MAG TPA: sigma-70 family RNA polymerase sigma factor [Gemmatimonadaceae bacterium]|nr:sigma-70 family RNA polymerase sigma factor [Gemmatimonadaceae bacterium]HXD48049.1 sigma-70 family RNA polymerase sigma factor [Gemmatimonadaceae bacterium]